MKLSFIVLKILIVELSVSTSTATPRRRTNRNGYYLMYLIWSYIMCLISSSFQIAQQRDKYTPLNLKCASTNSLEELEVLKQLLSHQMIRILIGAYKSSPLRSLAESCTFE